MPEDRRESEDEQDHDRVGRLGRDLDDTWVMVSPGIYRLREDMPQDPEPLETRSLDDALRGELPTSAGGARFEADEPFAVDRAGKWRLSMGTVIEPPPPRPDPEPGPPPEPPLPGPDAS